MKIVEIDFQLDLEAAYLVAVPASPASRSKGLHASDLYGGLFQEIDADRYKPGSKPHTIIMAVGLAWEQWLERTLIGMGELVVRPPEQLSPEGVSYSPDLFVANGEDRIGEIKTTCMSSKDGIEGPKFDKYHSQAMIYGYWAGTRFARFYVLFLRGDYKFMKKGADKNDDGFPEFHVYDVEYSAQELHENYLMLTNYGKRKGLL